MSGINQPKDRTGIPLLIHVLNVAGLMALSSILLISSVFRLYQFVALVAVFVAAVVVYWRFRSNANLVAVYFALPVSVGFWILLCENVVAVGAFQLSAQRDFARRHAWTFLDLTEPLRSKLKSSKAWIYGRHDGAHWSRAGSLIVADVLATELLRVIGPATPPKRATKTYINRQPALNSSCLRRSRSQPAALSSNCN
jgi:hypothetical protein